MGSPGVLQSRLVRFRALAGLTFKAPMSSHIGQLAATLALTRALKADETVGRLWYEVSQRHGGFSTGLDVPLTEASFRITSFIVHPRSPQTIPERSTGKIVSFVRGGHFSLLSSASSPRERLGGFGLR